LNGEIQSMIREAEVSGQPQQGVMVQQIREGSRTETEKEGTGQYGKGHAAARLLTCI